MSETRRRTELIPVRMTPAEAALLDAVVKQSGARGRGTVLREAFQRLWKLQVEPEGLYMSWLVPSGEEDAQDRPEGPGKQ